MKEHMQTVINVCLAIGFTLLIYQNIQLKDDVDTLQGYAQLDTNNTWDEIDRLKDDLLLISANVEDNNTNIVNIIDTVNDHANGLNVANNNINQLIKFNDSIYGNRDN